MGTCFRFSCTTMAARYSTFVAVVALYALSFHGSCTSSEAKAESKAPATDPSTNILRVDLIHRDSPISPLVDGRNLSNVERLRRAVERSHNRWRRFQHYSSQNAQSHYNPVNYEDNEYFMQMTIGSPVPLKLHFMIDTGSDLIWTQCQPCSSCAAQNDPMYNPFQSLSYKNVSCSSHSCLVMNATSGDCSCDLQEICTYGYRYADGTVISGVLADETFRFVTASSSSHKSISHLSFGCVRVQTGEVPVTPGIIGLGRGPLSLVSQMGSSIDNIFSYCLGSVYNASQISPLFLGRATTFGAAFSVTPLIQNDLQNGLFQSFYYLGLDGISVAGEPVPIPTGTFQIRADGYGGLIIDSGTTVTSLEEPGYTPFLDAVRSSITAQPVNASATTGFDLCYNFTSDLLFPNITLHFAGGADYVLPPENSFVVQQEIVCLAFSKSPLSYSQSLFGNFQQQNFHIVYDLGYNKLSFAPANCASI